MGWRTFLSDCLKTLWETFNRFREWAINVSLFALECWNADMSTMYGRWLCKRWCPILEADDEQSLQQFKQHEYSCWSSFTNIFLFALDFCEQNNKIFFPWKNCANMSVAVVIPWKCFLKSNITIWYLFLGPQYLKEERKKKQPPKK